MHLLRVDHIQEKWMHPYSIAATPKTSQDCFLNWSTQVYLEVWQAHKEWKFLKVHKCGQTVKPNSEPFPMTYQWLQKWCKLITHPQLEVYGLDMLRSFSWVKAIWNQRSCHDASGEPDTLQKTPCWHNVPMRRLERMRTHLRMPCKHWWDRLPQLPARSWCLTRQLAWRPERSFGCLVGAPHCCKSVRRNGKTFCSDRAVLSDLANGAPAFWPGVFFLFVLHIFHVWADFFVCLVFLKRYTDNPIWLVVWNMFFPKYWDNKPNWLSYVSEELKPPTIHALCKTHVWPCFFIVDVCHMKSWGYGVQGSVGVGIAGDILKHGPFQRRLVS